MYMKVKKEEIKQWINDVYTKLWALLSLYGETDGFNTVPKGEAEKDPKEFIRRKLREIRRTQQNFSLYMDEQEIAEAKKLKPKLMTVLPEETIMSINPEVAEISSKLNKIINDTSYFFDKHVIRQEAQGVVFLWGAINPHLTYFDRVFELMEKYPETYMDMKVQGGQFVYHDKEVLRLRDSRHINLSPEYPGPELVAERNAYFEKIKERNERENLNWSKERFFQEELMNTLKLLFEDAFREYL